jgi:hypothetical protein
MAKEIIKLRHFHSAIDANIAKSKLDAFGIPCFLTNEHFANLYPSHYLSSFQVMLHVFREDAPMALEILDGASLVPSLMCPKCGSDEISVVKPTFFQRIKELAATIFATSTDSAPQLYRCDGCLYLFKQR